MRHAGGRVDGLSGGGGMLKKGLVIIAVPFFFQILFIAALWKNQKESAEAQLWAIHTKDVIAQTETVARFVTEAQNAVRGLIVTGDPDLSETYKKSVRLVRPATRKLHDLVSDNPRQQILADSLKARIESFMVTLAETHRLALAGKTNEAAARVQQFVKARFAEGFRADIDRFLGEEIRLDNLRRERLRDAWRTQSRAIVGGALASAVAALLTVLAFSRGFARRVEVLGENARRLAEGKALVAPIGGSDELSRLDAVFHAMAASLAEKDRENEMFIFSVSHDLRSPLVNLQGFSRELTLSCEDLRAALAGGDVSAATRTRVDTLLDQDIGTSVQFIRTAVTRLSAIIDALLRLSRAGRVEYRLQSVDVENAVGRVVETLGTTIAQRGAQVNLGSMPPAWADPTALEQVFANLIGNALNYLDPAKAGLVEVGASVPNGKDGDTLANLITYYVKDNGLGVPEAYQAKLFHAFQRLHPDAAPGEGIGLALVRRVVERHGGKIWFESTEGTGSTFSFTLPAPPGPEASGTPVEKVFSVDGKQGTRVWPTTR